MWEREKEKGDDDCTLGFDEISGWDPGGLSWIRRRADRRLKGKINRIENRRGDLITRKVRDLRLIFWAKGILGRDWIWSLLRLPVGEGDS